MKFKGNILITDPCYITKDEDWRSTEELEDYYDLLSDNNVDSLSDSTGGGDGSWKVYKTDGDPMECVKKIQDIYDKSRKNDDETISKIEEYLDNFTVLGAFCADAGMSCVCDLKQLYEYNPEAKDFVEKHPWCCTVLENFDGEIVEEFVNIPGSCGYEQLVFVGKGNYNFFTF